MVINFEARVAACFMYTLTAGCGGMEEGGMEEGGMEEGGCFDCCLDTGHVDGITISLEYTGAPGEHLVEVEVDGDRTECTVVEDPDGVCGEWELEWEAGAITQLRKSGAAANSANFKLSRDGVVLVDTVVELKTVNSGDPKEGCGQPWALAQGTLTF